MHSKVQEMEIGLGYEDVFVRQTNLAPGMLNHIDQRAFEFARGPEKALVGSEP